MAVQTKAIKRRIKSVRNTRKITKAMELVAASKMRKAVNAALNTRPFSRVAWDVVQAIGKVTDTSLHPLLAKREGNRTLVILITSDRGLAGGFNANVLKRTFSTLKEWNVPEATFICVGKRGVDAVRRAGRPMIASFLNVTNSPKYEEILPIGRMAVSEFLKGEYDRVVIAFTDFVSAITQKPTVMQILPLGADVQHETTTAPAAVPTEYKFEPDPLTVLDRLLPRLVETTIYHSILESAASEHSARMMAMKNASEAASEMIDALTFTFNQARQAGITQEIAEISSGKAALETN